MDEHHLILGEVTDFLTGKTVADTHDERYRQQIARMLVSEKGFDTADIRSREIITVRAGDLSSGVPLDFIISVSDRTAMIVKYGPGFLVTRHRPALSLAMIVAPHIVPVVVVTNGETADVLDGVSKAVIGSGFLAIPTKASLIERLQGHAWKPVPPKALEMAERIVYAFEINGACLCDMTVCRTSAK